MKIVCLAVDAVHRISLHCTFFTGGGEQKKKNPTTGWKLGVLLFFSFIMSIMAFIISVLHISFDLTISQSSDDVVSSFYSSDLFHA